MTTLLIARHGNTFTPDDIPTRVGRSTDISLVESGQEQARKLAKYLQSKDLVPEVIFTSHLKRTIEMADIICQELTINPDRLQLELFDEIDYGPDENKPEREVVARLGEQAIRLWDEEAKAPEGWDVNPKQIQLDWHVFAEEILQTHADKKILVITSNGIARFAPFLTRDFESFCQQHQIKMKTGALSSLSKDKKQDFWSVDFWNVRPE